LNLLVCHSHGARRLANRFFSYPAAFWSVTIGEADALLRKIGIANPRPSRIFEKPIEFWARRRISQDWFPVGHADSPLLLARRIVLISPFIDGYAPRYITLGHAPRHQYHLLRQSNGWTPKRNGASPGDSASASSLPMCFPRVNLGSSLI
jgi:hypothetical protein